MTVPSYTRYDFPATDRAELFGNDVLLFLDWEGNLRFTTAGCFRVPKATTWDEFRSSIVARWFSVDPDYDHDAPGSWTLLDKGVRRPVDPAPETTLDEVGVTHKATLLYEPAGG